MVLGLNLPNLVLSQQNVFNNSACVLCKSSALVKSALLYVLLYELDRQLSSSSRTMAIHIYAFAVQQKRMLHSSLVSLTSWEADIAGC